MIGSQSSKQYGVWAVSRIMTYIFPIANILTSIPVFSIIIRYNLLQLKGLTIPVWVANILAVVLPWVVTLPFYVGDALDLLINWSSAIFFTLLNLLLPVAFWLASTARAESGLPPLVADDDDDPLSADPHDLYSDRNYLLASIQHTDDAALDAESLLEHKRSVDEDIPVLPSCCGVHSSRACDKSYANALFAVSVLITVGTFAVELYTTLVPGDSDDGSDDGGGGGGNSTDTLARAAAFVLAAARRS